MGVDVDAGVHVNAHVDVYANADSDVEINENAIVNKYVDCVHVRSHLNDM